MLGVYKNGEAPPEPKDKDEKLYFESLGIVYLDDEFENAVINAFYKSLEVREFGFGLNAIVLKEYAKRFEMEFLDLFEITIVILNALNKENFKKAKTRIT